MSILLPDNIEKVAADALENTAKPLSINVGKTIADLWYLVFGGISFSAEKRKLRYSAELKKFKEEVEAKCKSVPENELKEPDTQIAGLALEKSKFCVENETLRSMFSSLIASSMRKDKENIMHQSYAEIITQMSSDDAKALLSFENSEGMPIQNFRLIIDNGYLSLFENVWKLCHSIEELEQCRITIDSLSRLGLVNISYSEAFKQDEQYDELSNSEICRVLNAYVDSKYKFYLDTQAKEHRIVKLKGVVSLTGFGKNFLSCVV